MSGMRAFGFGVVTCLAPWSCAPPPPSAQPAPSRSPAKPTSAAAPSASSPTPADCSRLAEEGACLGKVVARRVCESFGPKLETPVLGVFLACLGEPGDPCDTGRAVRCGLAAIRTSPPDERYGTACASIAEDCADVAPELSAATCGSLLASFREEARAAVEECLRTACSTGSFGVCLP
ncbi:MAG TPA: hypothetical protein VHE30_12600 [Polyangiaceae bacterium]|nr:hypothetical protein [Polyangiaceae bacterium]